MASRSDVPRLPIKSGGPAWSLIFVVGISVTALVGTYMLFVEPPPPRRLVIATGPEDGAYHDFALQYARILEQDGLTLDVRETHGSVENLELLQDKSSGVSVALVQSGVSDRATAANLEALGSLYREPLWIFYREDAFLVNRGGGKTEQLVPTTLHDFNGKRIAVGPQGSGTRAIAIALLRDNEVPGPDPEKRTLFSNETGHAAAEALQNAQVDVAFFVVSIDVPFLRELVQTQGIKLLPMDEQAAYFRRYRFLSGASLPRGLVNLGRILPPKDIPLVAPTATLVARKDLHPALVSLLLSAAHKVHGGGDLLSNPDEFPSPLYTDLPLNEEAKRYFKSGPPVLQRILPFWVASLVDRLKVMLIPLIMLMMPLIRSAPPLMRWRTRRKIYRWYTALRAIDIKLLGGMSHADAEAELANLRAIEEQVAHVAVPLSYMEEFYNLRLHVALIRDKLQQRVQQS
ncbi:MAG: C4-dicarboxylate ABC transporter substrate-binding protein [Planctomycetes bacterium]|nr:C4-dicarboxylate ABC transporter substrate-binding protein [Planctomycetota bacterium]